jgi:IclR family acetate operon transcriptional repressor
MVLDALLRPVMEELTAATGQSTSTGIPSGRVFTIISTIQSRNSVRVAFDVGQRPYYHSAAIGKLLLATLPDDEVRAIVGEDPLPRMTPHTIGTRVALFDELARVRATGISISTQESILGVGAVAAGIYSAAGECVAGISVVYPVHMVQDEDIAEYSRLTRVAAQQVSTKLGTLSLRHSPSEHTLFRSG